MEAEQTGQPEDLNTEVEEIGAAIVDPEAKGENDTEQRGDENDGTQGQSKTQNAKQRLRRKLKEAESSKAQLEDENRKLRENLSGIEKRLSVIENPLPARPTPEDFESVEQYEDALYEWRRDKESREQTSSAEPAEEPSPASMNEHKSAPESQEPPLGLSEEQFDSWMDRYDDAVEKYSDYNEITTKKPEDGGPEITPVMAQTILLEPAGPEVAYHLGKNVAEANRIARLPFSQQIDAVREIAAKFNNTQSKAPEPIDPDPGTDDFAGKDPNKMSPDEYRRWRRETQQRR